MLSPHLFLSPTCPIHSASPWHNVASTYPPECLVAEPDEVVGELLDDVGGVPGSVLLAVVADDDGLRRLGDGNARPALAGNKQLVSGWRWLVGCHGSIGGRGPGEGARGSTYLATVQTPILRLRGDVSLPANVEALGEDAGLGLIGAQDRRDGPALLGRNLKAGKENTDVSLRNRNGGIL